MAQQDVIKKTCSRIVISRGTQIFTKLDMAVVVTGSLYGDSFKEDLSPLGKLCEVIED